MTSHIHPFERERYRAIAGPLQILTINLRWVCLSYDVTLADTYYFLFYHVISDRIY